MTDARLRETERRWGSGGALDWARLQRERARRGLLDPASLDVVERVERGALTLREVEAAAYLGEPRALALVGEEVVPRLVGLGDFALVRAVFDGPSTREEDELWLAHLHAWVGDEVVLRAAVEEARARHAEALTWEPPPDEICGARNVETAGELLALAEGRLRGEPVAAPGDPAPCCEWADLVNLAWTAASAPPASLVVQLGARRLRGDTPTRAVLWAWLLDR